MSQRNNINKAAVKEPLSSPAIVNQKPCASCSLVIFRFICVLIESFGYLLLAKLKTEQNVALLNAIVWIILHRTCVECLVIVAYLMVRIVRTAKNILD